MTADVRWFWGSQQESVLRWAAGQDGGRVTSSAVGPVVLRRLEERGLMERHGFLWQLTDVGWLAAWGVRP